jgi:hypothetical protein
MMILRVAMPECNVRFLSQVDRTARLPCESERLVADSGGICYEIKKHLEPLQARGVNRKIT